MHNKVYIDIIFSEVFIAKDSTIIDPSKNVTILFDSLWDIDEQRWTAIKIST